MTPRVAIVGSCVTRDLWPLAELAPKALCYISRTSLPSLVSPRFPLSTAADPPAPLKRHQHNALNADIAKTALETLLAFRPTHIIFDFIDERFDLLRAGEAVITRSWELTVSGYLDAEPDLAAARMPRLSGPCEQLWLDALQEVAALIRSTPLAAAQVVLHESRWAETYLDSSGAEQAFPAEVDILPGEGAAIADHNALLARYDAAFRRAFPDAAVVASPLRTADAGHRWGLSPFHYIGAYYADIRAQLARLGASAV